MHRSVKSSSKARSLPKRGAPERPERPAREKNLNLFGPFVSYEKKFVNTAPGLYAKFYPMMTC